VDVAVGGQGYRPVLLQVHGCVVSDPGPTTVALTPIAGAGGGDGGIVSHGGATGSGFGGAGGG
jgi:hypothetical protein